MQKKYRRSAFIFHRDLRLQDNTALNLALENSDEVITLFNFDPVQIAPHPYRSLPGLQFLIESLMDLGEALVDRGGKLFIFLAPLTDTLRELHRLDSIDAIYFNRDYTPFARNRDRGVKELGDSLGIAVHQYGDALLFEPEEISKAAGGPYTVFTPFYNCALKQQVRAARALRKGAFCPRCQTPDLSTAVFEEIFPARKQELFRHGGRANALKIIANLKAFSGYQAERDIPSIDGTTGLSAHHKFGTVSIREVYEAVVVLFGPHCTLVRELYWRDFFTHIGFHFPHVFTGAFQQHYNDLEWNKDPEQFSRWCRGETGFPIVDAGMRQLNATGFMHNRVRMIVASFLTKDLQISWREGEKYFATKLTDYDPAVNNGSWQWAASTGCDAQPYFRIFNPWLQQERFDPQTIYIQRWVPELRGCPAKEIHRLREDDARRPHGYPAPLVEHAFQKIRAEEMFRQANEKSRVSKESKKPSRIGKKQLD